MKASDVIKMRRKEMGLTMKEVASAVGVSEGTVSRWICARATKKNINSLLTISVH